MRNERPTRQIGDAIGKERRGDGISGLPQAVMWRVKAMRSLGFIRRGGWRAVIGTTFIGCAGIHAAVVSAPQPP
jgi:hypothetical protein